MIRALPLVHVLPVPFHQDEAKVLFYFFTSGRFYCGFHGLVFRKLSATVYLFSFRYDNRKKSPEPTTTPVVQNKETETPETIEVPGLDRPSPQVSEGSMSTGENVTAFIERTVEVMSQPDTETVDPLPNQLVATARMVTVNPSFLKISVSEPITMRNDLTHIETEAVDSKEVDSTVEAQGLYGDTTEAEDLMDSSGVAVFPPVAPNGILDPTLFPEFEGEFHTDSGHSDSEQAQYRSKLDGADRQLSANGKLFIKKYF